jgi:hypothetical protein
MAPVSSCDDCSWPQAETCCCPYVEPGEYYCPDHRYARSVLADMEHGLLDAQAAQEKGL